MTNEDEENTLCEVEGLACAGVNLSSSSTTLGSPHSIATLAEREHRIRNHRGLAR